MQQYQFPQGFLWGAAASGPQTEGVTNKRHRSIWDSWFAEQPERFYQQVGPARTSSKPQPALTAAVRPPPTWR